MLGLVLACTKLCGACPRMSVGYAEVLPFRPVKRDNKDKPQLIEGGMGKTPAYFTRVLKDAWEFLLLLIGQKPVNLKNKAWVQCSILKSLSLQYFVA